MNNSIKYVVKDLDRRANNYTPKELVEILRTCFRPTLMEFTTPYTIHESEPADPKEIILGALNEMPFPSPATPKVIKRVALEMAGSNSTHSSTFGYYACIPVSTGLTGSYELFLSRELTDDDNYSLICIPPYKDNGIYVCDDNIITCNASIHMIRTDDGTVFMICDQSQVYGQGIFNSILPYVELEHVKKIHKDHAAKVYGA